MITVGDIQEAQSAVKAMRIARLKEGVNWGKNLSTK